MFNLPFITAIFVLFLFGCSQPEKTKQLISAQAQPIKQILANIREVPTHYTNQHRFASSHEEKPGDSVYQFVLRMDTAVIDKLIDVLSDTTVTAVSNSCTEGNYTYGQLAFLLIDDIEDVPYFAVTHIQFDVFDCGTMPNGLLDYVKNNSSSFQQQLRSYFHSKARQGRLEEGKEKERLLTQAL